MTSIEIADRVEDELKKRSIKKSVFYEKCGVSRASFSQWKHGLHYPTKETLDKINEFLGLSFSVTEGESAQGESAQKETPPTPDGGGLDAEFVRLFQMLTPEQQARELAYLRELTGGRDRRPSLFRTGG